MEAQLVGFSWLVTRACFGRNNRSNLIAGELVLPGRNPPVKPRRKNVIEIEIVRPG